jgi:hypothetical protein
MAYDILLLSIIYVSSPVTGHIYIGLSKINTYKNVRQSFISTIKNIVECFLVLGGLLIIPCIKALPCVQDVGGFALHALVRDIPVL